MNDVRYMKPNNPIQISLGDSTIMPVTISTSVRHIGSTSVQDALDVEFAAYNDMVFLKISRLDYNALEIYDEKIIYLIQ